MVDTSFTKRILLYIEDHLDQELSLDKITGSYFWGKKSAIIAQG